MGIKFLMFCKTLLKEQKELAVELKLQSKILLVL